MSVVELPAADLISNLLIVEPSAVVADIVPTVVPIALFSFRVPVLLSNVIAPSLATLVTLIVNFAVSVLGVPVVASAAWIVSV